jgi:undecaprenyl-phosphate 4-deoxy-4-formamido-L-arabinose transferase
MKLDAPNGKVTPEPELSLVIPVYRSEDCLRPLIDAIQQSLIPAGLTYEIILVNDCSPDRSWHVIEELCQEPRHVRGLDLRRNFGQDNAIMTGLRFVQGKYVVILDDDLQHDPHDIPGMLHRLQDERADVVYADFRAKHQKWWKNLGSWFNGKMAEWVISKPKHVYLSPYKIITRAVAELICRYDGPDPYIDGLLFQVTSRITQLPVEHHPRHAGTSSYTLMKSIKVWARLACSFSVRPLRLVTWCGFLFFLLGVTFALLVIAWRLLYPEDFPEAALGWASLIVLQLVVAGVQMLFFGVLGEYAGRTYLKVNNKPQTAIRVVLNEPAAREPAIPVPRSQVTGENRP